MIMSDRSHLLPVLILLGLIPVGVGALPDDREKPINIDASSNEVLLDEGLTIYYGSSEEPAVISQGSMRIAGQEISVKRVDGAVEIFTVTGSPARFEQQPGVDQAIIHGSGGKVTYDRAAQLLTIEEDARLIQGDNTLNAYHVEYDMAANRVNAKSRDDADRIHMSIQPDSVE